MSGYTRNWVHTAKSDAREEALKALERAKELEKQKLLKKNSK